MHFAYHNNNDIEKKVIFISHKTSTNKTLILLGKNITYFRQLPKNQWSQETLAQKMNSDKSFISQVENAKRNVSTEYINRLCQVFNIEPMELFKDRNFNLKARVDSKQ